MEKTLPKLVKLDWVDVQSLDSSLLYLEEILNLEPCKASLVGWLVHENEKNYYVAKEYWENGGFKYLHVVPKNSSQLQVTELKEAEEIYSRKDN